MLYIFIVHNQKHQTILLVASIFSHPSIAADQPTNKPSPQQQQTPYIAKNVRTAAATKVCCRPTQKIKHKTPVRVYYDAQNELYSISILLDTCVVQIKPTNEALFRLIVFFRSFSSTLNVKDIKSFLTVYGNRYVFDCWLSGFFFHSIHSLTYKNKSKRKFNIKLAFSFLHFTGECWKNFWVGKFYKLLQVWMRVILWKKKYEMRFFFSH